MFVVPTPQLYLAPTWMFQFYHRIGLSQSLRLLEGKALPADTRTTIATIRARSAIQDTVTSHPYQDATRLILQGGQEVVVAVLGIGNDEVEILKHFRIPMATQLLDLLYTYLDIRLLEMESPQLLPDSGTQVSTE